MDLHKPPQACRTAKRYSESSRCHTVSSDNSQKRTIMGKHQTASHLGRGTIYSKRPNQIKFLYVHLNGSFSVSCEVRHTRYSSAAADLRGIGVHLAGPDALRIVGDVEPADVGEPAVRPPLEVAQQQVAAHHHGSDQRVPQQQTPSAPSTHVQFSGGMQANREINNNTNRRLITSVEAEARCAKARAVLEDSSGTRERSIEL